MKILGVYPITNQETRIQPFFNAISKKVLPIIDTFIFFDENGQDNSIKVLDLELKSLETPNEVFKFNNSNRAQTIIHSLEYAKKNHFDFIIFFNEGWQDNIEEVTNIILTKEYVHFGLVTSCRHVHEYSLGSLYNFLSNLIVSFFSGHLIQETKGDSINIVKSSYINIDGIKWRDPTLIHLNLIFHMIKKSAPIMFTDIDNGLNFKSYVKLNTVRFMKLVFCSLFPKTFYKKF